MESIVKLLVGFALLFFSNDALSQGTFYITAVKGSISTSSGARLSPGMVIKAKEQLTFNDSLASANAIDDRSVVFTLMPIYTQPGYSDAANVVATLARKPLKANTEMFIPDYPISDLSYLFGNDRLALIADITTIPINTSKVKLASNEMLVFTFKDQGATLSRRIPMEKGSLIVDKSKFWNKKLQQTVKIEKVDFYIVNSVTKKYSEVASIQVNLVDAAEVAAELRLVKGYLQSKNISNDLIKSYLKTYFYEIYGRVFSKQLGDLVDSVMNS